MTASRKKNAAPAVAAAETAKTEDLGEGSMNNQSTRPAVEAWNRAVDGETIPDAPDLAEQRWGEGFVDAPDWAIGSTTAREASSAALSLRAGYYDNLVTNKRGVTRGELGLAFLHIVQGSNEYVPRVNIAVHRPGVREVTSTQIDDARGLSLLPHELQPMIEALSAARDLIIEEADQ